MEVRYRAGKATYREGSLEKKEGSSEFGGAQSVKEMSGKEIGRGEEKLQLSDLWPYLLQPGLPVCLRGGILGKKSSVSY